MEKKTIRVKDIMRTHFGCIDRRETVRTALSMMQDSNARALIVNKRDAEDELGIVVLADIATTGSQPVMSARTSLTLKAMNLSSCLILSTVFRRIGFLACRGRNIAMAGMAIMVLITV